MHRGIFLSVLQFVYTVFSYTKILYISGGATMSSSVILEYVVICSEFCSLLLLCENTPPCSNQEYANYQIGHQICCRYDIFQQGSNALRTQLYRLCLRTGCRTRSPTDLQHLCCTAINKKKTNISTNNLHGKYEYHYLQQQKSSCFLQTL